MASPARLKPTSSSASSTSAGCATYILDGTLDAEGGAALKTAIDSLAKRHAPDDQRTPRQRRADALVELVHHALDEGRLPRRNGVRPHVTVTTTLEGLESRLGAPASELETRLGNLLMLCWYHHRCVHEGGWQVVKAGEQFRFIPPERVVVRRARGPGMRWAA